MHAQLDLMQRTGPVVPVRHEARAQAGEAEPQRGRSQAQRLEVSQRHLDLLVQLRRSLPFDAEKVLLVLDAQRFDPRLEIVEQLRRARGLALGSFSQRRAILSDRPRAGATSGSVRGGRAAHGRRAGGLVYACRSVGNFWAFILLIGPLILVHELGHLLAAKLVDVKASRFSIGFGPPILRMRLGETEYCLAPIPLGGYVTLLGLHHGEDIPAAEAERALSNKPLWARYFVLAAGPLANLVLPVLLFFFYYLTLAPTTLPPAIIGSVIDGSAAAQADLQQGDRIVAIEGRDVRSWREMSKAIADAPGRELEIQIER